MTDPARVVLGGLADRDRRLVLAALELAEASRDGAGSVTDLVSRTGLAPAQVTRALGRLVDSGLVIASPDGFRVDTALFAAAARQVLARPASHEHDDRPAEQRKVFDAFVRDGRITAIPVAPAKLLVLADWLAQRFDPGRRYGEREVNEILAGHHDDFAVWRRLLVDHGFLSRTSDGRYWRTGGTFDPAEGRR